VSPQLPRVIGTNPARCPLCEDPGHLTLLHRDPDREYWICGTCDLVHVPAQWHPDPVSEKRRYDKHSNDPADPGYRKFLHMLADPVLARLPAGSRGLDFGCGPAGALAMILAENGMTMARFDPFYAPDGAALEAQYDFVVSAEAFEHFFRPALEWQKLLRLLRPGGLLGVMTGLRDPGTEFGRWWYRNDFTHVCYYSRRTFEWLATRDRLCVEFPAPNAILLWHAEGSSRL
jgi:SAM-dependent methyltransferase